MACGSLPHVFVPGLGVAQVNVGFLSNLKPCFNVWYVYKLGVWEPLQLKALLDVVEPFYDWPGGIGQLRSFEAQLVSILVRDMSFPVSFELARFYLIAGAQPSPALPNNVTVMTRFETEYSSDNHRGRTYFVGVPESMVTGELVDPVYAGTMDERWKGMKSALELNGWTHVVASMCKDGGWRDQIATQPVVEYTTDRRIASQRMRLSGR